MASLKNLALLTTLLAAGCAGNAAGTVRAVAAQEGDSVVVSLQSPAPHVEVRSKRGIGSARLILEGRAWPTQITVHLVLDGLESLEVTAGEHTGKVAFSSTSQQVLVDAASGVLSNPRRTRDGFTVTLTLQGLAASSDIELRWVDFFR